MNKLLIFSSLLLSVYACKTDNGETLYPNKVSCDTANIKYASVVQPIMQTNCLNQGCHTAGNPSGGYQFDSYANFILTIPGDKLINSLKYLSSPSKNMPPTGKLSDCDFSKVEAWIKRGYPNN